MIMYICLPSKRTNRIRWSRGREWQIIAQVSSSCYRDHSLFDNGVNWVKR